MENLSFENIGQILREGDTLETMPAMGWLSASGTLSKSVITVEKAIKNLQKHYKTILTDFPTLRIKLVTKNKKQYWYYAIDKELQFNNLIKVVNGSLKDEVPEPYALDIAPLWRLHITPLEDKIKFKILASYGITDGRTLFDLLDLFISYALNQENLNEKLNKARNQPVLYEFGKKDWFTPEIINKSKIDPFADINFKKLIKIHPSVKMPSHVINPQWDVPYLPISQFCRKHGITPQAILMAIQNEAIRNYNKDIIKGINELSIPIYIPVDNRKMSYTTELFKKSLFFSHVGVVMPFIKGKQDFLENMIHCSHILKEAISQSKSCEYAYHSANVSSFETENYSDNFPDPLTYIFASHLGLVGVGYENIQFRSYSPVFEGTYWPNLYGFHNKETFSFMFNIPYNLPDNYLQSVKDTSLKYYNFIVENLKEK